MRYLPGQPSTLNTSLLLDYERRLPASSSVIVLGTGEFAYKPFQMALQLERAGFDVRFQTTTRSPAMLGGAIRSSLTFTDNYGDSMVNFLYNVQPGQYDQVLICCETPECTVDPMLVRALNAQVLQM